MALTKAQQDAMLKGFQANPVALSQPTGASSSNVPPGVDPAYHAAIMKEYNDSVLRRPADQASANAAIEREKAADPVAWGLTPNQQPVKTTPGTAESTGMVQAIQSLPSYVPPASTGLNFDQAKSRVSGQIDPMFARALEALKAQKHQDQLNGGELASARGGAHSGLAADLQNKVGIAAAGKASDLDATRQTQIAEMANALVNRGEDNDYRNKQAALAEYLGLNQLDLQRQGQKADYTGVYQGGQTMQARQIGADNAYRDKTFDYNTGRDTVLDNRFDKQLERSNFESDRSYNLAKSGQEWGQLMQKETFDFNKAQAIWDNNFKDKTFQQSMNDAAASRGLQWASLNQRDKEFLADQTFRDKSFTADQEQRTFENGLKSNKPATTGKFNLDDFKGYINQNFYKDVPANPSNPFDPKTSKQFDKVGARKYILSQNLEDAETDQILKLYELPTK